MAISTPLVDLPLPQGFPADLIPRARLTGRLDSGAPVAVLVAPAGHGKTTLAAQWADQDRRPARWVRLRLAGAAVAKVAAGLTEPWSLVIDDVEDAAPRALDAVRELADRVPAG